MPVQLFIKKIPNVIKELISREALENRRSINQEAIALLEEALVSRAGAMAQRRRNVQVVLEDFAALPRVSSMGNKADGADFNRASPRDSS